MALVENCLDPFFAKLQPKSHAWEYPAMYGYVRLQEAASLVCEHCFFGVMKFLVNEII